MKTLKTLLAVLIIAFVSSNSFAQGGLLGKAKEATAKKKDAAKDKGGKGGKDMAVKGTGTPKNAATTAPVKTPAATNTNK
ncbi:MAG TPA: hypothetical protein VNY36_00760 [Bacteroidia bacterium]|jgi:hypothetical protein|nr:hypothetical protein [Bacteroidia bacterium]